MDFHVQLMRTQKSFNFKNAIANQLVDRAMLVYHRTKKNLFNATEY